MEKFVRVIDRISHIFGVIAGIFMIFGVIFVLAEIVARNIFDSTLYVSQEYTAYFMIAITFFGLAYTLKEKGHIRLTFIYRIIKGGKARILLDIYSFVVGLALFSVITYMTADFFWDSVVSGTRSMQITKTYLSIPRFAMPLGSLIITLQFAAEIVRSVNMLRTGEIDVEDTESQALGR